MCDALLTNEGHEIERLSPWVAVSDWTGFDNGRVRVSNHSRDSGQAVGAGRQLQLRHDGAHASLLYGRANALRVPRSPNRKCPPDIVQFRRSIDLWAESGAAIRVSIDAAVIHPGEETARVQAKVGRTHDFREL